MSIKARVHRLERKLRVGEGEPCRCGPGAAVDVFWPNRPPAPWLEGMPRKKKIDESKLPAPEPKRCSACGRLRLLLRVRWKQRELPDHGRATD